MSGKSKDSGGRQRGLNAGSAAHPVMLAKLLDFSKALASSSITSGRFLVLTSEGRYLVS